MAFTKTFNRMRPAEDAKAARTHLAAYMAIVATYDAALADPEDWRPIGGQLERERKQAVGIPVDRYRFDRATAEQIREALHQMLADAAQATAVAGRR